MRKVNRNDFFVIEFFLRKSNNFINARLPFFTIINSLLSIFLNVRNSLACGNNYLQSDHISFVCIFKHTRGKCVFIWCRKFLTISYSYKLSVQKQIFFVKCLLCGISKCTMHNCINKPFCFWFFHAIQFCLFIYNAILFHPSFFGRKKPTIVSWSSNKIQQMINDTSTIL